jgi:hypothetical protein
MLSADGSLLVIRPQLRLLSRLEMLNIGTRSQDERTIPYGLHFDS